MGLVFAPVDGQFIVWVEAGEDAMALWEELMILLVPLLKVRIVIRCPLRVKMLGHVMELLGGEREIVGGLSFLQGSDLQGVETN